MEGPISHHFPTQHLHNGALFHAQPHHNHPTLVSQLDLDPTDHFPFAPHIDSHHHLQHLQHRNAFEQTPPPSRFHDVRNHVPSTPQQNNAFNRGGEFGVLTPHPQLPSQTQNHQEALGRLQNEIDLRPVPIQDGGTTEGHFSNLKMVPDPPNLDEWRKRLFDVDEIITLTEDEYNPSTRVVRVLLLKILPSLGSRHTFPMWTTYIRIGLLSDTNANRLCLTIGTVGSKGALLEHQNRRTQTRKRGNVKLGNGTYAMSRSKLQSTSLGREQ